MNGRNRENDSRSPQDEPPRATRTSIDPVTDAVVNGLFGIAGIVVGAGATWWFAVLQERRRARVDLRDASIACLGRLRKLQAALAPGSIGDPDSERWLLGGQLDRYSTCIAAAATAQERRQHWPLYAETTPILVRPAEGLADLIKAYETLNGLPRSTSEKPTPG
jgi:hypothetical protein